MNKTYIAILIVLLTGCSYQAPINGDCKVIDQEKNEAEKVARRYAKEELGVESEILDRAACTAWCREKDGKRVLVLEFSDTKFFPEHKIHVGVLGGFPHYFVVDVDIASMEVVGHYASNE